MEEKCKECCRPLYEYNKTCLNCHCSYCYSCEDKHTRNNSGHSFRLPPLDTYSYTLTSKCTHPYKDYNQFCQDCNALVCSTCLTLMDLHKGHRTRQIDQFAYEQKQEVTSEIEKIVKSNKKAETQLVAREINLDQLIEKANDIDFDLSQEYKRINALILEKRQNLTSIFKSQQNEDLCAFLAEIKSLKVVIRINKELEKHLKRLLEETENNKTGFLTGYADFRKYSAMMVKYPKAVGDEFLSMEIAYQKSTDEEIKNVLPRICIGNTHYISRARRKQEEENDSKRTQKDTKEKDKQITDLEEKLRSTCKVIEVLNKNVTRLVNASSSMDGQCSISLEPPRNIPIHRNMDTMIGDIHLSMENIKRNIEEKNTLLKMIKETNKELEENVKRRELKTVSTTEVQKVKDLQKHITDLENRLKASDAIFKEQEKRIKSEELKDVSTTEIRNLKKYIGQLESRLKTSDAHDQAKEQEECIRREKLERSAVEIQKWKKNVVEIQDRYETICEQNDTMKRELKRSEEEKENLMTRLSQVAGAKLTAGNSSIADLGDKYRPTRISDMFAEMYDSDWTDVMDGILESHKEWTEELVVRHIFIVLQECFRACKRIATEQMKRLCEDMFLSASTQDLSNYVETHVTEIKQLQDARKGTAPFVGKMLKERVFGDSTFRQNCRRIEGINIPLVSQITASEFGQKCVAICWFMVVQDPEMYIDGGLQPGIQFDRDVYKEYTRSGKCVAFSVWPALYLHEGGPLLTKGVAQPYD